MAKTIVQLHKEIAARQRDLKKLQGQRRTLARQLAGIDRQIAEVTGRRAPARKARKAKKAPRRRIAARRRKAVRGKQSLSNVLATALKGKGNVRVAEAAKLALAAGYKSASSQFANIVSQTLSGDRRFRKLARGVYALKGAVKAAVKKAPGKAPLKAGSLKDTLVQILTARKAASVGDAVKAVLAAGYKTTSKNFRLIVNQTLLKDARFKKVGRGTYALKA